MAIITPSQQYIFTEETQYSAGVSEATLTKMGSSINFINENGLDTLGSVVPSILTLAQFASQKGFDHTEPLATRKWTIQDGSSIAGSDLNTLTGIANLPNMVSTGRFMAQSTSEGNLGVFQDHDVKSHNHDVLISNPNGFVDDPPPFTAGVDGVEYSFGIVSPATPTLIEYSDTIGANSWQTGSYTQGPTWSPSSVREPPTGTPPKLIAGGGTETRPKSYSFNYFIKINN